MFPCEQPGKGVPGDQAGQALAQEFLSGDELARKQGHEQRERARYRWPSESVGHRDGQLVVVAKRSTDEGGEVRSKRPTRGKARSGIASCWPARREGLRAGKPSQQTASNR